VYRKEKLATSWTKIGCVEGNPNQERFSFVDQPDRKVAHFIYAVSAVDIYNNESEYSDPVSLSNVSTQ
jgi:hypothetical protein